MRGSAPDYAEASHKTSMRALSQGWGGPQTGLENPTNNVADRRRAWKSAADRKRAFHSAAADGRACAPQR